MSRLRATLRSPSWWLLDLSCAGPDVEGVVCVVFHRAKDRDAAIGAADGVATIATCYYSIDGLKRLKPWPTQATADDGQTAERNESDQPLQGWVHHEVFVRSTVKDLAVVWFQPWSVSKVNALHQKSPKGCRLLAP